ncbi:MAG: hypothetical protein ACKPCM_06805 [Pseudanabaena sp.]
MSQAGFGDSSSQESINPLITEPQSQSQSLTSNMLGDTSSLLNSLPRQVLEQELQFCNERSQQAQVLLRQAQEQLQLSQLVIQRQETLTQTLQARIDQLERELQDVHTNCDELRDRLKRQQHQTSQLKAALERCLDTSTTAPKEMALSALESWSIAKLADEKIAPIEAPSNSPLQNVVKITPIPQPIAVPETLELAAPTKISEEPESIEEPAKLFIPAKNQPISPLIVKPHKASQGSPISPNLPKWQASIVSDVKSEVKNIDDLSLDLANKHTSYQPEQENPFNEENRNVANDSPAASAPTLRNSSVMPTVTPPKFMQSLYGNANHEEEEPPQLAIANSAPRKAVSSLAAVQLPQFPPLPRQ